MASANIRVIETFVRTMVADNLPALRDILCDDVVVHEASSLPYGGDHHGIDAFVQLCESVASCWQFVPKPSNYTYADAAPDTVLLRVDVDVIARPTGYEISPLRVAEFFRIRDGKIAELEVFYWDTGEMCRALGLPPQMR